SEKMKYVLNLSEKRFSAGIKQNAAGYVSAGLKATVRAHPGLTIKTTKREESGMNLHALRMPAKILDDILTKLVRSTAAVHRAGCRRAGNNQFQSPYQSAT